jgi:hypothetical protein
MPLKKPQSIAALDWEYGTQYMVLCPAEGKEMEKS